MGLFDKAKELAKSGAEAAKTGAINAKQSFDEKSARADATATEKENEGLSSEEIVAKDEAKKIITFITLEIAAYLSYQGGDEFWSNVKNVGKPCQKAQTKGSLTSQMGGSGYKKACYFDDPRFRLKFKNESEKRMKYVHLDINGINAVGDIVETKRFDATGPIEPGKKFASDWTDASFKASVTEIQLKKITIEFFDGDDVVLEGNWLDRLIRAGAGSSLMNFAKA